MRSSEKAEQILDMFDIRHEALQLMIEEALAEAAMSERDYLETLVERRLALARRAYERSPHKTYLANVVNALEEFREALGGREESL